MLILHIKSAVATPKNISIMFPSAGETTKGMTIEAKKICPKFANMPDTVFICSELIPFIL